MKQKIIIVYTKKNIFIYIKKKHFQTHPGLRYNHKNVKFCMQIFFRKKFIKFSYGSIYQKSNLLNMSR